MQHTDGSQPPNAIRAVVKFQFESGNFMNIYCALCINCYYDEWFVIRGTNQVQIDEFEYNHYSNNNPFPFELQWPPS